MNKIGCAKTLRLTHGMPTVGIPNPPKEIEKRYVSCVQVPWTIHYSWLVNLQVFKTFLTLFFHHAFESCH